MKLPEDSRAWIGGGVAAAVVVLAGGWFGLIHPELSSISGQHAAASAASAANDVLQSKVTTLRTESRQMPVLVHQLAVARDQLPIQADLPTFIRQLGGQARTAGLGITSLSIGAVSVSTAAATTGSTDSTTDGSGTAGSGTASGDSTTSSTTSSTAAAPVTAAGPAGELFQIQVTITTRGLFTRQQAFLTALQSPAARAALITSAQLASGSTASGSTAAAAAATPGPGTDAAESGATAPTSIAGVSELTTLMDIFVAPQTPAAAAELSKQLATRTTR